MSTFRSVLEKFEVESRGDLDDGELVAIDGAPLGLTRLSGEPFSGEVELVLFSEEAVRFRSPPELAKAGILWVQNISKPSELRSAVKDAHNRVKKSLKTQVARFEAWEFDASIDTDRALVVVKIAVAGHRSTLVADDEALSLEVVDDVLLEEGEGLVVERLSDVDGSTVEQAIAARLTDLEEAGRIERSEVERAPTVRAELAAPTSVKPTDEESLPPREESRDDPALDISVEEETGLMSPPDSALVSEVNDDGLSGFSGEDTLRPTNSMAAEAEAEAEFDEATRIVSNPSTAASEPTKLSTSSSSSSDPSEDIVTQTIMPERDAAPTLAQAPAMSSSDVSVSSHDDGPSLQSDPDMSPDEEKEEPSFDEVPETGPDQSHSSFDDLQVSEEAFLSPTLPVTSSQLDTASVAAMTEQGAPELVGDDERDDASLDVQGASEEEIERLADDEARDDEDIPDVDDGSGFDDALAPLEDEPPPISVEPSLPPRPSTRAPEPESEEPMVEATRIVAPPSSDGDSLADDPNGYTDEKTAAMNQVPSIAQDADEHDDDVETPTRDLGDLDPVSLAEVAAAAAQGALLDYDEDAIAELPSASPMQEGFGSGFDHLADIVGEGISSGKTGAIVLDASAFKQGAVEEARALETQADELEQRARALRAQATKLRAQLAEGEMLGAGEHSGIRSLAGRLASERAKKNTVDPPPGQSGGVSLQAVEELLEEATQVRPLGAPGVFDEPSEPAALDEHDPTRVAEPAPARRPIGVALIVNDERARGRLVKLLDPHIERLIDLSEFHELDPTLLYTAAVLVRPRKSQALLDELKNSDEDLPIIVISSDDAFDAPGVAKRVPLGRKASEVARSVVDALKSI